MPFSLRSQRDLGAGLFYAGLGFAAVWMARDYDMGTLRRIGPAFFPSVLGAILTMIGLVSLVRAFVVDGEPVGRIAWAPMVLVTLSIVAFAALLEGAGLAPALVALVTIGAAAGGTLRFSPLGIFASVLLIAGSCLVFVTGLGIPVPILGPWFGG